MPVIGNVALRHAGIEALGLKIPCTEGSREETSLVLDFLQLDQLCLKQLCWNDLHDRISGTGIGTMNLPPQVEMDFI